MNETNDQSATPESDKIEDVALFEEKLEEAVCIRSEIDAVHWQRMRATLKCMAMLFSSKPTQMKQISNLYYYGGGYPSPNSPSHIEVLVNSMVNAISFLHMLGDLDLLTEPLKIYGIDITVTRNETSPTVNHSLYNDEKFLTALSEAGLSDEFTQLTDNTDEAVFRLFLDHCQELQGTICKMADSIKIDIYEDVKIAAAPGISKGTFVGAVRQNIDYEKLVAKGKRDKADKRKEAKIKGHLQAIHVTEVSAKL